MAELTLPPADRPVSDPAPVAQAADLLALLNAQADVVRTDLAQLRHDLGDVQRDFLAAPGALMREANEHLVRAAIRAEAISDAATCRIAELAKAGFVPALANSAAMAASTAQNLREANERLVIAALNAQQLEATAMDAHRKQVAFLATVAHELRNPLMPLRLAAFMLDRARTDDVAHAKLQATITSQVAQMTRLIGDLLDGSRLSTGTFRLERLMIDMGGVIGSAIETCRPAMDARHQQFVSDLPPGPIRVLGDPVRLVQVFSNLLENSSKYTPEGGTIALKAAVLGDSLVVTVRDDGIGISAKALPHVFDLFVRDAHATAVNSSGLGIGLAVVRELVRAHEGRVVVTSAGLDKGCEFVVTLPVAPAQAVAPNLVGQDAD